MDSVFAIFALWLTKLTVTARFSGERTSSTHATTAKSPTATPIFVRVVIRATGSFQDRIQNNHFTLRAASAVECRDVRDGDKP
jgi:hypothetical protein